MLAPALHCPTCKAKTRKQKNCHNRQKRKETIVFKDDWGKWPKKLKFMAKWGEGPTTIKFFECPKSAITRKTWEILALVEQTTDYNPSCRGTSIAALPFEGAWLDQPPWYRQAFKIVRDERITYNPPEKPKAK